jgi:outer membrane protein assembly factor BamB
MKRRASRDAIAVTTAIVLAVVTGAGAISAGERHAHQFQPTRTRATAYLVNPRHDGVQTDPLVPPLHLLWKRRLPNPSYALVASGKVFVTTVKHDGHGTVRALDVQTGRGIWTRSLGRIGTPFPAYGDHRIFVLSEVPGPDPDTNNALRAYLASNGKRLWQTRLTGESAFTQPPTAAGEMVYANGTGAGARIYAVRALDGDLVWESPGLEGGDNSPAVSQDEVIGAYGCEQIYAFDRLTGHERWHHDSGCSGSDGRPAAVYRGRVYTSDPDLILDASDGSTVGTYRSLFTPSFAGGLMFTLPDSGGFPAPRKLAAVRLSDGMVVWRFRGDRWIFTTLVDGDYVYAVSGRTGRIWAIRPTTGRRVWTIDPPGRVHYLSAGGGLLLASHLHALLAFA